MVYILDTITDVCSFVLNLLYTILPFLRPNLPTYEQKKRNISIYVKRARKEAKDTNQSMSISGKTTTNLFRMRDATTTQKRFRIDVSNFNKVIHVNKKELWCDVEGMTTYEDLVKGTLPHGVMPTVVPELKSITIGGAISGIGIESSSFRYGFVHETILEMDILLGDGQVVTCSPINEYADLFKGIPNSYGTLGYVLRCRVQVVPVKKYIQLRHFRCNSMKECCEEMRRQCDDEENDFVDGVIFAKDELYVTAARFVDTLPRSVSPTDYRWMKIFYLSIKEKNTDYLTTEQYIWRWDHDWFWCSRYFYMQDWLPRLLFGGFALKSSIYMKVWRKYREAGLYNQPREFVIQDVEIPIHHCEEFMDFFQKEIGISPVWMCPVIPYDTSITYPLYTFPDGRVLHINFGFWDSVAIRDPNDKHAANRLIEAMVTKLEGKKSLYSTSFYSKKDFWSSYNQVAYDDLKRKYDPKKYFLNLYDKCVRNH